MLSHYLEVARRSPKTELARVAARRVLRLVHRTRPLAKTVEDWTDDALERAAFGGPPAFCSRSQRHDVVAAVWSVPGAAERGLTRAQSALSGVLRFFGTEVRLDGTAADWSVDARSGRSYPLAPSGELPLCVEGMDPKFAWAVGRLDHAVALAQGYWLEPRPRYRPEYAEKFVDLVDDFVRFNPVGKGIQWASPMEVALRGANVAWALRMFEAAPEVRQPAFLRRVLGTLMQHAHFVEQHLEDHWLVANNHLVANHVGLLVMGALCPELPGAARRAARSVSALQRQMELQVHADGVSFEGSVSYHRLSVELFLLGHLAASASGQDMGDRYSSRLHRMFEVVRDVCSERGLAPQLGDNDSGRALPLCDRPSLDHGYLLPLGATLFGDPALKEPQAQLCDEAAWLFGERGLRAFLQLRPRAQPRSFSSKAGGLHVLRGAGAVVSISAGPVGQRGVGGHSHNDRLSFELHVDGVPTVVDPGTGTYTRDSTLRNALRSTGAHNTLQLDGCEQAAFDGARLFALPTRNTCGLRAFGVLDGAQWLTVADRAYGALPRPVEVERTFALNELERTLALRDAIAGEGRHRLVLRLHLPDQHVRLRAALEEELARARRSCGSKQQFGPWAAELGPPDGVRAIVLFGAPLQPEIVPDVYSPGYGELSKTRALIAVAHVRAPSTVRLSILLGAAVRT